MRYLRSLAASISLILASALVSPVPATAPAPPALTTSRISPSSQAANPSAPDVEAMFGNYGNSGGHWTGGDSTVSVPLPDGRTAWLFSDTFLGKVNSDFSRPETAPFINNSIVVQNGTTLGPTIHGGTSSAPKSLVIAEAADEFYWVGDATIANGSLRAIYGKFRKTGDGGPFGFERVGTTLVTLTLPGLTVSSVRDLPLNGPVGWGAAIMEDGSYTYIYGSESAGGLKFGHIARVAAGDLGGTWQFWTGNGWSAQESASARLMSGVTEGMSVHKAGSQYVLVTQDSHEIFSHWIVAYTATSPTGPFTGPVYLEKSPEPEISNYQRFIYHGRVHPQLSDPGELFLSYDVNTIENSDHYKDVRIYRPRFLEVPWPPTTSGGPAAPTGLRVKTSSDGIATISWTPPAGNSLEYWVYRKNLGNGQTHFARTGYPTDEPRLQDAGLDAGVDYAYYVRAVNAAGVEGTPTGVVTTRGSRSAPPAPTGLSATAGTAGDVTLTWTAPEEEVAYLVHQRDITAGETEFTQAAVENGEATTQKIESLETGHQYEFKVTASNTVGESAPSNLVQTTANFAVPGAPTGLTATAEADATVTLRWTVPSGATPDAYQVYHRAAGTTDFTPLDLPADTTTIRSSPLISGTTYDFKVTALNTGGEGQASTVVNTTALMRPPAAPANMTATATTDGTIKLTWNTTDRAGAYWVRQRDVTAGQTAFSPMDSPVETTTTTADRLLSGHMYEFKVIAIGDGGEGPASAPARAVADLPRPAAPTALSAAAGDRKVTLTWQKAATAGHYWVYRRDVTAGETAFVKQSYPALEPRAELGLLTNAHTYEFKVTAENEGGESSASTVVSARPMPPLPPKVTGLTATARAGGKVALTWNAIEGAFYWVHYRDVTVGQTTLTKLEYPATSAQAEIGPFTGGHEYEFAVAGTNEAGDGPLSDRARVTATASTTSGAASGAVSRPSMLSQPAAQTPRPEDDDVPGFPGPPSNLRVVHVGVGYVDLDWDPSRDTDAWYQIHFKPYDGKGWYVLPVTALDSKARAEKPLWNNFRYEFRVVAVNRWGPSSATNTVEATPRMTRPRAPTGLAITGTGTGRVELSWQPSPDPPVYYWVFFKSATSNDWYYFQVPTLKTSARLGYPLWNDQPYDFKVVAANLADQSPTSNVVRGGPRLLPPQAPTALRADGHLGYVNLDWNPSSTSNVYYWVWYRRVGSSWRRAHYPVLRTSLTFKYVQWGNYEFKVTAENRAGRAESNVAYGTLWTSKRSLAYLMTLSTEDSRDMFWNGRDSGHYQAYDFNWNTNFCTHSPNEPPVGGLGPMKRVNFRRPCARHDFGYRNYPSLGWGTASKRAHLDAMFLSDMRRECDRQLDWRYNVSCYSTASIYWSFVRAMGSF